MNNYTFMLEVNKVKNFAKPNDSKRNNSTISAKIGGLIRNVEAMMQRPFSSEELLNIHTELRQAQIWCGTHQQRVFVRSKLEQVLAILKPISPKPEPVKTLDEWLIH